MRSWFHLCVLFALLIAVLSPSPAAAIPATLPSPPVPGPCGDGTLPGGALSRVCVPSSGWNGDVVVWAHGYVAPNEPIGFHDLTLADGTDLTTLAQRLGFAFATTSYRTNGLAVAEGMVDIRELVAALPTVLGKPPRYIYLTGASEGGLIATALLEQSPELFSGGLAVCAPIGDFGRQVNYWGDVRVLFDYFFPNIVPGGPTAIPPDVIAQWGAVYAPAIRAALQANPRTVQQLLRVAQVPFDKAQPDAAIQTTLDLLWYHITATNDEAAKLGGNPYDNHDRHYSGSNDDRRLNQRVARITSDPAAREALGRYETTGQLARPLVTLHTTRDPIVPYWHAIAYVARNLRSETRVVTAIPISRAGHCTFTAKEIVSGFSALLLRVRMGA